MTVLPAVIAMPDCQKRQVTRLVDYCRQLDGTELVVVPISDEEDRTAKSLYPINRFACLQAKALRKEALAMKGQTFIHLEPDSIPLVRRWREKLTKEYEKMGRHFLLPAMDDASQFDISSGIGVYSPDTHWLIPDDLKEHGWDYWMIKHLKPMIGRTKLIQHVYGEYNEAGIARPLRFPQDKGVIRRGTVLFHRDKFQDLIADKIGGKGNCFYHTGDLGDIIASLPIIRQLGGGDLVIGNHDPLQPGWRKMEGERYDSIRPLLSIQPYLSSVSFEHKANNITHDFSGFRKVYRGNRSLLESQRDYISVESVDVSPWLNVEPLPEASGLIVVNRTRRYNNPTFPWRLVCMRYRSRIVFLGLKEEHAHFCRNVGVTVRHVETTNLLDVARWIKGSSVFIGNQSVACWIAMGLGHNLIQETWPVHPDSIIQRPNARFVMNGGRDQFRQMGIMI